MTRDSRRLKIGIIGHGEIGKAIESLYLDKGISPEICELTVEGDLVDCDFIHVCIPYKDDSFVDIVVEYLRRFAPGVAIIHSTVGVGTTRKIQNLVTTDVCHSPIRGLHPNLKQGILTFPIYIGVFESIIYSLVYDQYSWLGIPSCIECNPEETELAKLLDTTYYGICIAFHKEVAELCGRYEVDFDKVMTQYNQSYNEGYPKLGKPNVVRPVLDPVPGPIGGHCVVPNARILSNIWTSPVLDLILKHGGK